MGGGDGGGSCRGDSGGGYGSDPLYNLPADRLFSQVTKNGKAERHINITLILYNEATNYKTHGIIVAALHERHGSCHTLYHYVCLYSIRCAKTCWKKVPNKNVYS